MNHHESRKKFLFKTSKFLIATTTTANAILSSPSPATAASSSSSVIKSRSNGYPIQHSDEEWMSLLSSKQYSILRLGGTERPFSSILESNKQSGTYVCAGCGSSLFPSHAKFSSGTGWPSFASYIDDHVEIQNVNMVQYQLFGAEVRCSNCGGHLGDVFGDGILFPGTPAFESGKRFCIDGAALLFYPDKDNDAGSGSEFVRGDLEAERTIPSFLQAPEIQARPRDSS